MARKAKSVGLVIVGGDAPQKRKASKRDWPRKKVEDFLSTLAETCNVTLAAAEAGVSLSRGLSAPEAGRGLPGRPDGGDRRRLPAPRNGAAGARVRGDREAGPPQGRQRGADGRILSETRSGIPRVRAL